MEENVSFGAQASIDDCVNAIMGSNFVCSATFIYNSYTCACVMPGRFHEGCEINGEPELQALPAYAIVQEADMDAGYVAIGANVECSDIDEDFAMFASDPASCAAATKANTMCSSIFEWRAAEFECLCLPSYVKCDADTGEDGQSVIYAAFDATATGTATGTAAAPPSSGLAPLYPPYGADSEWEFEHLDKIHEQPTAEEEGGYEFGLLLALGLISVLFGAASMYVCQNVWKSREERAEMLLDEFSMHQDNNLDEIYVHA